MNKDLSNKLIEDSKYLMENNFYNVCLVKTYNESKELIPKHIIFNFWVDLYPITFIAKILPNYKYDIYIKNDLLEHNIEITKIEHILSMYTVKGVQNGDLQVGGITITKSKRRKSSVKKTISSKSNNSRKRKRTSKQD